MSEVIIANHKYTKLESDGKTIYKSVDKINGYKVTITCLGLPGADEKALLSIKNFFKKEIF
ncbi:hypothetical protein [Halalkalibacter oceani]|uniref:hypothetical protein n=1 Tax=Halalkalibacter oceani TaxID=1653776 RepID=UPI0033937640